LCKRTSARFAKLLPSLRCVGSMNNYAYDLPRYLMDLILAILEEVEQAHNVLVNNEQRFTCSDVMLLHGGIERVFVLSIDVASLSHLETHPFRVS